MQDNDFGNKGFQTYATSVNLPLCMLELEILQYFTPTSLYVRLMAMQQSFTIKSPTSPSPGAGWRIAVQCAMCLLFHCQFRAGEIRAGNCWRTIQRPRYSPMSWFQMTGALHITYASLFYIFTTSPQLLFCWSCLQR